MAQVHFSDETLMAFADGELDEKVAVSVEQAMSDDPAIAQRVAGFMRSRRIIRSAFQGDALPDVPPELRAAVLAQIERIETPVQLQTLPEASVVRKTPVTGRWRIGLAMAASIAAIAIATFSYLAGRQSVSPSLHGPVAHLSDPEVSRTLSESASGQDRDLSFGRIRVVSTFRVANGSLCREFNLHTSSGSSDAVACHANGWMITFAVASASPKDAYVPSDGADLMASYLQSSGAGEPLLNAAEMQALGETRESR
jgi:hypothetical protein